MTREEVVQAALTVERWCKEQYQKDTPCDCPFHWGKKVCMVCMGYEPKEWDLEKYLPLRGCKEDLAARGLKDAE